MHHLIFLANWDWFWNPSGRWYIFWSGFGSDLGELAILGSIIAIYRRHKCSSCWRLAHHPVPGTNYRTCHKHSTIEDHDRLYKKHQLKFPKQHELLAQYLGHHKRTQSTDKS